MDFYNSASGQIDELYQFTPIDFSNAVNPVLTFSVAYCQYSSENDRLEVRVSTDCGATWTSLYNKAGTTLATTAAQTAAFTPTTAAQWRSETVSLSNYTGQPSVLLSFKATSAYGNNLYVDDINISGLTSVNQINGISALNVFPNPTNGLLNINASLEKSMMMELELSDISGRQVYQKNLGLVNVLNESVDLSNLSAGVYTLAIRTGSEVTYQIITVK